MVSEKIRQLLFIFCNLIFNDCLYAVIDFCLTKSLVKDTFMNFCTLKLEWASKNSLEQRAGRVGRVSDGRVYRLIIKNFYAVSRFVSGYAGFESI